MIAKSRKPWRWIFLKRQKFRTMCYWMSMYKRMKNCTKTTCADMFGEVNSSKYILPNFIFDEWKETKVKFIFNLLPGSEFQCHPNQTKQNKSKIRIQFFKSQKLLHFFHSPSFLYNFATFCFLIHRWFLNSGKQNKRRYYFERNCRIFTYKFLFFFERNFLFEIILRFYVTFFCVRSNFMFFMC